MYSLNSYDFGNLLKKIRKAKKISVKELAKKIQKTESTVYKYETNQIIPDIITILEICNVLDIDVDDLCNKQKLEEDRSKAINPFTTNKLYIYYIAFNGNLAYFELEIESHDRYQKVYFKNVPKSKEDKNYIYYIGTLESDSNMVFINLQNNKATNRRFEKVQIEINLNFSSDEKYLGVIMGTNEDKNYPSIRKCMIMNYLTCSRNEINEIYEKLKISEDEIEEIKDKRYWEANVENESNYSMIYVN